MSYQSDYDEKQKQLIHFAITGYHHGPLPILTLTEPDTEPKPGIITRLHLVLVALINLISR